MNWLWRASVKAPLLFVYVLLTQADVYMMAKLALQLQSIVIVLTVFLIVIGHYVYVTSEPMRIYRGDYDTFDKPTCLETADRCTNCRAMNAYCNRYDTHLGCLECTCCGQYRTYLRYFGKCVRDNKLLFFSGRSV